MMPAGGHVNSAPPVFIVHSDLPDGIDTVDICEAAEKVTGFGSIVGCQRIGSVWRLYPLSKESRAKLVGGQLCMGGRQIPMTSQNPFAMVDGEGKPVTRLTIDRLPVSVAGSDLEGYLRQAGAMLRSPLQWEKARNRHGELTRFLTGRRYVLIDLPTVPLPHSLQVGSFVASLYYREQPKRTITCFVCKAGGHKRGDPQCPGARPAPPPPPSSSSSAWPDLSTMQPERLREEPEMSSDSDDESASAPVGDRAQVGAEEGPDGPASGGDHSAQSSDSGSGSPTPGRDSRALTRSSRSASGPPAASRRQARKKEKNKGNKPVQTTMDTYAKKRALPSPKEVNNSPQRPRHDT